LLKYSGFLKGHGVADVTYQSSKDIKEYTELKTSMRLLQNSVTARYVRGNVWGKRALIHLKLSFVTVPALDLICDFPFALVFMQLACLLAPHATSTVYNRHGSCVYDFDVGLE